MLANLGNDEEMPSMPGSASPPRSGGILNTNNIPDIDAENGEHNQQIHIFLHNVLLVSFR